MTQADRDRLVTLKKAKKRLITQREAAEELGLSIRQVKRLLKDLKKRGDRAVIHGLRGKPSNRKIDPKTQQKAVEILSLEVYRGFGPTLACEYLSKKHGIDVSRETARQWMKASGLWKGKRRREEAAHLWRPRRSRCGELVQWDTSEHDWLEGRGSEQMYLISMIDDATSRLYARFVRSDSTEENMRTLWSYVELYGRPLAFYTDKASLFRNNEKRRRDQPGVDQDPAEMPPTQIGRALRELDITWIAAHSPQAKGRIERSFDTAQDRLVKQMRVAGVKTCRASQRVSGERIFALVESDADGAAGRRRQCASGVRQALRSGGDSEPCGNAPGEERLHDSVRRTPLRDQTGIDFDGTTRWGGSGRETSGRLGGGSLPGIGI